MHSAFPPISWSYCFSRPVDDGQKSLNSLFILKPLSPKNNLTLPIQEIKQCYVNIPQNTYLQSGTTSESVCTIDCLKESFANNTLGLISVFLLCYVLKHHSLDALNLFPPLHPSLSDSYFAMGLLTLCHSLLTLSHPFSPPLPPLPSSHYL